MSSDYAQYIPQITKSFQQMIEITDDKIVDTQLRQLFLNAIVFLKHKSSGENSIIYDIDSLIKNPLIFLSQKFETSLRFGRNIADGTNSTISVNGPNFLVWNSKSILVFKGEEKENEEDLNKAKKELVSKCGTMSEMFFGQIPYVFCYAAAGTIVYFFAIDRNQNLLPLSDAFDIGYIGNRLRVVTIALNIAWCLRDYEKMENSAVFPLSSWIKRNNGVEIYFGSDFVEKRILSDNYELADINILIEIYEAIKNGKISNTIKCKRIKENPFKITLTPICCPFGIYKIDTNEKLLKALKSVVAALKDLHSCGFVHRDIRWENVLFDSENYLLTDFECAGKIGQELPSILRTHSNIPYPDMIKKENVAYNTQVDLYLVGKLIEYIQNKFKINKQILDLINDNLEIKLLNLNLKSDQNLNAEKVLNYLNNINL